MIVTIAVCTWNRAVLLDKTLAEMRKLRVPAGVEWELLVVDNNSTDHTNEVIDRHSIHLPLRTLVEREQGLSQARNCAWREAKGDLVAFVDDDVLVNPDWLTAISEAALRWPNAGYFGGPVLPWYETLPPHHIGVVLDELANGAFLGLNLGEQERLLKWPEIPRGANMVFHRHAANGLEFDPAFGRTADNVWFGDELDFFSKIRQRGFEGAWIPSASLQHFVPTKRVCNPYLREYFLGLGTSMVRQGQVTSGPAFFGIPRWILKAYATKCIVKYLYALQWDRTGYFRELTQQWRFRGIIGEYRRQALE